MQQQLTRTHPLVLLSDDQNQIMKEHRVSVTRAEAYFRLLAVKAKSYPYAPSLSERTFMATTILCSDGMRRKSRNTCKRARTPTNHTSSARALGARNRDARTPTRPHARHTCVAPTAPTLHKRRARAPRTRAPWRAPGSPGGPGRGAARSGRARR